jgi:hypothetical protein
MMRWLVYAIVLLLGVYCFLVLTRPEQPAPVPTAVPVDSVHHWFEKPPSSENIPSWMPSVRYT